MSTEEIKFRAIGGTFVLTRAGMNTLRRHVGLDPIRPRPGETWPDFKKRYREESHKFFEEFPGIISMEDPT